MVKSVTFELDHSERLIRACDAEGRDYRVFYKDEEVRDVVAIVRLIL